jgi:hypothetical protein
MILLLLMLPDDDDWVLSRHPLVFVPWKLQQPHCHNDDDDAAVILLRGFREHSKEFYPAE